MITAGIDVGSTTTKLALADEARVVHTDLLPTGVDARATVARLLDDANRVLPDVTAEITHTTATGYGRNICPADSIVTEITANARAAASLSVHGEPVQTVIDIGGQDTKVIRLDQKGFVRNFAMNDRCAAGTGRFLEVMARVLEMQVTQLACADNDEPPRYDIDPTCTVFAESEVVSLLSEGVDAPRIVNALHRSIAKRIATLARRVGVRPVVICDGGTALNSALVAALQNELGHALSVPENCQYMPAIGAAAVAASRV
ncbi:MAG: acyl-CoA dehydratase activase [Planctomycetota bacterium]|nr:acyl-CoA dehydratase activase [Planctomycetota bacterium]